MNKVGLAHRPVTGLVGGVNPTKIDLVLVWNACCFNHVHFKFGPWRDDAPKTNWILMSSKFPIPLCDTSNLSILLGMILPLGTASIATFQAISQAKAPSEAVAAIAAAGDTVAMEGFHHEQRGCHGDFQGSWMMVTLTVISGETLPLSIWDLALPHSRYPVWV